MRKYAIRLMLGLFIPAVLGLTACGGGGGAPVASTAPVANAGADQTVLIGKIVTLDGSKSSNALNYNWSFISWPTANKPILDITDPLKPTFTASVAGKYVIELVVNDGTVASAPSRVTITAVNNTGSITVTYSAPAVVTNVKVFVSGADFSPVIVKDFLASAGSGTIDVIPVGTGRTIKVWGMDATGIIRYQGAASGITVNLGSANPTVPITMIAPVTTASPVSGSYPFPVRVTLTANEPATIYYTTSGFDPTTLSAHGTSPFDILISSPATLRFFAIDSGFAQEVTRTETYN